MMLTFYIKPNAKKDDIYKDAYDRLKVHIKAPPVDGKANAYLIRFLADYFEIKKSDIILKKGEHSSTKTIEIRVSDSEIQEKLAILPIK